MKFEPEHIEMTITDIPSIIGEEIGLWRVLQIYNYYVRPKGLYSFGAASIQKQKILIELVQKYRDSFFKINDRQWVSSESITFSEEYLDSQKIKTMMNKMGYDIEPGFQIAK